MKNEESRPVRRLSENFFTTKPNMHPGEQRAWEREVRRFNDEELIACVRAQVAVDRACNTYRKSAAAPYSFDVPS